MSPASQVSFDFRLRNEFSLDNFVVSARNTELLDSLMSNQQQDRVYFIWGVAGSGKSHLLQACCALQENSVYVPLTDFAEAGASVLEGLEQLDLVCLDDIQKVLPSAAWEENLFRLFNAMQQQDKRLLIASQIAPAALTYSLADLQSRFSSSMVYQLHEMDDDNKFIALKKRAQAMEMPLEDDVLQFICSRAERSTQHLFVLLDELAQSTLDEKRKLTVPYVKSLMNW